MSPVNLHGAQHELLTERSCFVSLWNTKLDRHLRSLSTLTCFLDVDSFQGSSLHSEKTSKFLCNIWKRNEHPNVEGVSIRSRNGAPSRKGCVVNGQMIKASNK